MSLTHTSDDSLARILHFLAGEDITRLMATGSRQFAGRVTQNVTELFWRFSRPTFFPSCSYVFANLRSLSVHSAGEFLDCGSLSLKDHPLLPPEPMAALESLSLHFQLAHWILAPPPASDILPLSHYFPRLTSLSIRSTSSCKIPDSWVQSLPRSILSLKLDVCTGSSQNRALIPPSTLNDLPRGIEHLELGAACEIASGGINLVQFEDLRVARLSNLKDWKILKSLPNSLVILKVGVPNYRDDRPSTHFAISKLPPALRSLHLDGKGLLLDFDSKASATLEEVIVTALDEPITPSEAIQHFHLETLRTMSFGHFPFSIDSIADLLPNIEHMNLPTIATESLESFEVLPRKLKTKLTVLSSSGARYLPLKDLPPSLEGLYTYLSCAEDVTTLPRSLLTLSLGQSSVLGKNCYPSTLVLPPRVWLNLPPRLTRLNVCMRMFDSEQCLHALPATLENLSLEFSRVSDSATSLQLLESIYFPKTMEKTLKTLHLYQSPDGSCAVAEKMTKLVSRLGNFSSLSTLSLDGNSVISSDSLCKLPKSLTSLNLVCKNFENYGLPKGKTLENADWREGALSQLTEGLLRFTVQLSWTSTEDLDFGLFSMLPQHLSYLNLSTCAAYCKDPKPFVAMLPKRIEWLSCTYNEPNQAEGTSPEAFKAEMELFKRCKKEYIEALADYYSHPFWIGFQIEA